MRSIRSRRRVLVALGMIVALAACASAGGTSAGTRRSSSTRLVAADFETDVGLDVYSIIQRYRPRWLQVRGGTTAQGPARISVIIDGTRQQGSLEILRSIRGSEVDELRFLNARDATTRYGTDMTGGAIEVDTKH
jgi:hypothetical protein